uniref:Ribosomal protein S7 n=1 Tax=Rhopalocnemis phalloides TaxID=1128106 RepID=A0A3Q8R3G5_9MAGN|nr:ribosomal protein S7 [Rhopalocnemis phalloides]
MKKYKILNYDPIYNNKLLYLWIQLLIKHGKKSLSFKIVYKILNKLKKNTNKNPIFILYKSIFNNENTLLNSKYRYLNKKFIKEIKLQNIKKLFFINFFKFIKLNLISKISFKIFLLSKTKSKIKSILLFILLFVFVFVYVLNLYK